MRNKQVITECILALIPEEERISVNEAMLGWWYNIRDNGGLRLTPLGYYVLKDEVELESWSFPLAENIITKKLLLDLDRKLEFPYYIERRRKNSSRNIVFFSSKEAMMANLYGDLTTFLKSLG